MSTNPDVSVVVPTYNGAAYLEECLASIVAQDLTGVEVLVADDGSSDATVEIARSFQDRIGDLRVVENTQRLGAVGNVNHCLELARGRWVKPVFQDDLIVPTCLSTMRAARQRGVPLVVAGRAYRYEDDTPIWQREACQHLIDQSLVTRFGSGFLEPDRVGEVAVEHAAGHLPHLNFIGEPVSILIERRAARRAGGFDPGYVQLWDYELLVRMATHKGLVLVAEPLATFRVHTGSETSRNFGGSAFGINVVDRLRLHVAYARLPAYRRVRMIAAAQQPPVDLMALALGVARAGARLVEEIPESERSGAQRSLDEYTPALPQNVPADTPSAWRAQNAEIALLLELSDRDLPDHLAVILAGGDDGDAATAPAEHAPSEPEVAAARTELAAGATAADESPAAVPRGHPVGRALRALRTNQWWGHMLGPIVAFACLQLGWRQILPGEGIIRVVALVGCAVALASYGYVVNDTADVVPDRLAGKRNAMSRVPSWARLLVILVFALAGALPWLVIPLETPALVALAACYLIPIAYSMPPIRLKERHILGPIADASNAFAIPAMFTIALFAPLGEPTGPSWVMVAGALLWTYGFGLRAILKHQIDDASNDRSSGTTTLVGEIGEGRAMWLIRSVLFPAELMGLALLVATVLTWSWATVAIAASYAVIFNTLRLTGVVDRGLATTTLDRGYWMYWYQVWPGAIVSLGLAAWQPAYLLVTIFIVALLWPRLPNSLRAFRHASAHEVSRRVAERRPGP